MGNASNTTVAVGPDEKGLRLDKWLVKHHPAVSRKKIKQWIDTGKVFIGSKKVVIANWELRVGDRVRVEAAGGSKRSFVSVYFEDRDLIVVEKPAGVLAEVKVDSARDDLVSQVKQYLKRKHPGIRGSYVKPLHRLDAETSGIMVLAKSKAGEGLEDQFRQHAIRRSYLAVVEGQVEKEQGLIKQDLEKGEFGAGKKVKIVRNGTGTKAITEFRVLERYPNATLLQIDVQTGRTHQIRVHLEFLGHPILGDKTYGGYALDFPRQALHATILGFRHPVTGKKLQYKSPLPTDLQELIDRLRG